jgi:hypothetical protein
VEKSGQYRYKAGQNAEKAASALLKKLTLAENGECALRDGMPEERDLDGRDR